MSDETVLKARDSGQYNNQQGENTVSSGRKQPTPNTNLAKVAPNCHSVGVQCFKRIFHDYYFLCASLGLTAAEHKGLLTLTLIVAGKFCRALEAFSQAGAVGQRIDTDRLFLGTGLPRKNQIYC